MKRIKFDNLSKNWKLKLLVICSIIFLFLGIFEISVFNDSFFNESFIKIGFLFQVLFFGRMFVYKNYVQWNKKGIYVKVNRFIGINFSFEEMKYSEIASHLNISVKTVENHMGKALKLMREHLKDFLTVITLLLPWLLK